MSTTKTDAVGIGRRYLVIELAHLFADRKAVDAAALCVALNRDVRSVSPDDFLDGWAELFVRGALALLSLSQMLVKMIWSPAMPEMWAERLPSFIELGKWISS